MAGNVKEWCQNEAGEKRAILGGGWPEPSHMYYSHDAQNPFDRTVANGFRCAVYPEKPPPAVFAPMKRSERDYSKEKPASDDAFQILRSVYAYDATSLEAKTERVDDTNPSWRKETVSYRAAYGNERIPAYLYLPRNAKPPYQVVVWVPAAYALFLRSSDTGLRTEYFNFLASTGRAVLQPVYKGTFERRLEGSYGPNIYRDMRVQYVKDFLRSLDYLESRPEVRKNQMALFGVSDSIGPILMALDQRLKTGILVANGLFDMDDPPEINSFHFAPRVRAPVLMLNGRHDFTCPEACQEVLFRTLGSPEKTKRHVVFETGHVPPLHGIMRETLNWLDQQFGPVEGSSSK
jgi:eukaryotic-like serine/threonine-protein kinase